MSELTLVGLHEDGDHVLLKDSEGHRFRVHIDEALRAAVRRDRPHLELARAELASLLPPREIQARIRAGASAAEVADQSGTPIEVVRRYEGPVLAEREFVSGRARSTRIDHDPGSPELGDLVTDRLANRGVPIDSIQWDAFRRGGRSWTIEVRFADGGTDRSARWVYDAAGGLVRALDDEARWLSETELPEEPVGHRRLTAVRDRVFDVEVAETARPLLASVDLPAQAPAPDAESTDSLLEDLNGRRGVRQQVDPDDDEPLPAFGPSHAFDFQHSAPATRPPLSRSETPADARVLPMPATREAAPDPEPHRSGGPPRHPPDSDGQSRPARGRPRKGRASVPSWDEIVFGAKPE